MLWSIIFILEKDFLIQVIKAIHSSENKQTH